MAGNIFIEYSSSWVHGINSENDFHKWLIYISTNNHTRSKQIIKAELNNLKKLLLPVLGWQVLSVVGRRLRRHYEHSVLTFLWIIELYQLGIFGWIKINLKKIIFSNESAYKQYLVPKFQNLRKNTLSVFSVPLSGNS